jgi:hypothetical protein
MTTEVQEAQDLYNKLKPEAVKGARAYVMARTPTRLCDEMVPIIDADIPPVEVPTVIDAPFISQTGAGVASTLNCTLGNWNGAPSARAYQWKRGATNVGTSSATYTVTAPDIGQTFTCTMVATNGVGASLPTTSNAIVVA